MLSISFLLLLSLSSCSDAADGNPTTTDTANNEVITTANNNIGGVVSNSAGPEAGIWVVAGTVGLDTFFARIVVTDAQGRFLIPDLPAANYQVWTRGYGLADSPKLSMQPGATVNLHAVIAENDAIDAQVYPTAYW